MRALGRGPRGGAPVHTCLGTYGNPRVTSTVYGAPTVHQDKVPPALPPSCSHTLATSRASYGEDVRPEE